MCKKSLKSEIVQLNSYLEHDRITADTQAVTHLAFLSMGQGIFLPGHPPPLWTNHADTPKFAVGFFPSNYFFNHFQRGKIAPYIRGGVLLMLVASKM